MRTKSCSVSAFSSTRIGSRPWSSGSRSAGFAMWNAPLAMNRIWSVFSGPYLVATVVPSISGRRSRWTPSRLTEPPRTSLTAILSISSRKTMPLASASASATRLMSSGSTRLSASSSVSRANASGTFSLRRLRGAWPESLPIIDFRSNTCAPIPGISNGSAGASSTSISTSAALRLPSVKRWRKLWRVASLEPLPVSASSSRSIAASSAAARTLARRRSRSSRTASSTRSRAICSTSRPT